MADARNKFQMLRRKKAPVLPGQVVLVFQGGGALGAYQGGVYQALHEAGIEPDWVIGTSIGAINAAIIAGNEPGRRLDACANSGIGWSANRRGAIDAGLCASARSRCWAAISPRR